MISRRRFIRNAATGLFVPSLMSSVLHGSVPAPLGFFKVSSSAGGYDADTLDWVIRVQGRGSDVSTATKDAVNTLVLALKSASLRPNKLKRVGVYAGNGLVALEAPLYKDWGNTEDVLNNFVSGDYAETGSSGGLTGNFTTSSPSTAKVLTTGINMNSVGNVNSYAYGFYNRTATNEGAHTIRWFTSGNAGTETALAASNGGNSYFFSLDSGSPIAVADNNGTGLYVGSRTASNLATLWNNGASLGTTTVAPGSFAAVATAVVHGTNDSLGGFVSSTSRTLAFYFFGTGLDSTDIAALTSAVQTFQTALSRQV